jgi:hypothetical protein
MILPSYRSLRMFSWLLLIAAFFQLYARKDGLLGVPGPVGMRGAIESESHFLARSAFGLGHEAQQPV